MSVSAFPYGCFQPAASGASGTVTVSGELGISGLYNQNAGIRVNTDGTIDKVIGGTYTQIDASTDWIIPNGSASSLYECRVTNVVDTGGAGLGAVFNDSAAAANNTWIAISSNRQWSVIAVGPYGSDSHSLTFDLEIRYNGGATLDTGAYSVESNGT